MDGHFLRYRIAVGLGALALLCSEAPVPPGALLRAIAVIDDIAAVAVGMAADLLSKQVGIMTAAPAIGARWARASGRMVVAYIYIYGLSLLYSDLFTTTLF